MRKITCFVVPVVVLGAWLLPGRPAEALTCPHHRVCVFSDANLAGQQLNIRDRNHRLNPKLGNQMDNLTSSWVNNTPYAVSFYEDIDGGGIRYCVPAYEIVKDLPGPYHDFFSATKVHRRSNCGI